MELKIVSTTSQEKGKIKLPEQFSEPVREDIIRRAVHAMQSSHRQNYGSKPGAGMRPSAKLSRRRRNYKGTYGKGISRVPRKTMTRRGTQFYWVGAWAPSTVGGRAAHPPKAEKDWSKKVNRKENRKAIRSAITATISREIVEKRGHAMPKNYPFAVESKIEEAKTAKEAAASFMAIGLGQDMLRGSKKKIRPGKGKRRGRKYRRSTGPLVVVSGKCSLLKSARNIAGIDVAEVSSINAEMLAPGAVPGRLTVFTEKALEEMAKKKLFM